MAVCGPKLSICCMLLSVWGVVQLGLMGVFFYINSVAFFEDLAVAWDGKNVDDFAKKVDDAYAQNAINVWIAAGIYGVIFLISFQQFKANQRKSVTV